MGWNLARLGTQLLWVVLLARILGADGYGSFSGISGLAIALSGMVGAGLGWRLYQDVTRERGLFATRWAQAIRALCWTSAVLVAGFVLAGRWLFPQLAVSVLVAVALTELALTPVVHQLAFAFAAHGQVRMAAAAPVALSLARVIAVLLLPVLPLGLTLETYALLHLLLSGLAVGLLRSLALRLLAPGKGDPTLVMTDLREGLSFSFIWASGMTLTSLDKTLVLRLGGADAAGQYTAAFRFASLAAVPVEALATAVLPRLFHAGGEQRGQGRLLGVLLAATLAYGLLAGLALGLLAPVLPWLLREGFNGAVAATEALALYVPAYCLYLIGIHVLIGFGWKRLRLTCDVLGLLLMAVLMGRWVPTHGAVGAAHALLAVEVFLAAGVWVGIAVGHARLGRAER